MAVVRRPRPLPLMFVPKLFCLRRIHNFNDKFIILDDIVKKDLGGSGERISFHYDLIGFFNLLIHLIRTYHPRYFRIYIATYDGTFPGLKGQLTLIINACNEDQLDIEDYYYFDETTQTFKSDNVKANDWVKLYQTEKLPHLQSTLDPHDPYYIYGDSKSFLFTINQIRDLVEEIDYQVRRPGREVFGINVHFGTYDISEPFYKKRTSIGFTFAKNNNDDIYIEDMNDADKQAFELSDLRKELLMLAGQLDTGSPCPPNNNCTGSLLYKS